MGGLVYTLHGPSVDSWVCTSARTGGGVRAGSAAAAGEAGELRAGGSPSPAQAAQAGAQEDGDPFPPGPHLTGLSTSRPHGGGAVPPGRPPDPGSHPDPSSDCRRGISRSNRETRGIRAPVVRVETALGLFLCQDAPRSGRPRAPESRFGDGAEEGLPGGRPSLGRGEGWGGGEGRGGLGLAVQEARPCAASCLVTQPRPWLPSLALLPHGCHELMTQLRV